MSDGHEQWVDAEYLDELTSNTLDEVSETRRLAALEPWHPGIMQKVEGYGRYCVRQFGPDGNACLVDKVDETKCVALALLPRHSAVNDNPSAVNDNVDATK